MSLPCDDMHWHWGPAVAGALARSLSQEGWSGTKIAKALGITSASVSYFLKYKRGMQPLPPSAMNACMKLCKRVAAGKVSGICIEFDMAKIAVMARHEGNAKMQKQMLSVCRACLSPQMSAKTKPPQNKPK